MARADNLDQDSRKGSPALSRRNFIIGGVLLGASGVAFARQPEVVAPPMDKKLFESLVPRRFGNWQSITASEVVLPPPDALSDRLYDNLVTRAYTAPGEDTVMLLLAYNNKQDGVLQVHRPEVCYPVGGFNLSATRPVYLDAGGQEIPANFFTAVGPDRTEQVAYFTRLGSAYPRSWAEQRLAVVRANLAGDIPDGMMLRVSVLNRNADASLAQLEEFTNGFIAAAPPRLRRLLVA
ncbi:exosortase-associated protein EpsI, V-type [Porphyrobacter sp. GA68]|uniref:exosortase-associated protein EpsI, V-type n=1 Tax=Porphyrobacter sp. GA68 TaxID=2883480 RepID=UPI001D186AC9|nr:exosortase-associated protein EpsI, V-type [Porphyrobacter sp. GA68]